MGEIIETERLVLVPLEVEELRLWIGDMGALERKLDCIYKAEPMEGMFREIVKGQLKETVRDPEHYYWHSFWFLIRKSDRVVVGSADFKDKPDGNGEVEIGYGLGEEYEHNGYMTEAVEAMCRWALDRPDVSGVIAETEADGAASQKLLERCGFVRYKAGETYWWRRRKSMVKNHIENQNNS